MKRRALLKGLALLPALPLLGQAPLSLAEAITAALEQPVQGGAGQPAIGGAL